MDKIVKNIIAKKIRRAGIMPAFANENGRPSVPAPIMVFTKFTKVDNGEASFECLLDVGVSFSWFSSVLLISGGV